LIEAGIDVNARTDAGFTALHFAARNGHVRAAELLIAAGADVNAQTPAGQAPLHFAVRRGYCNLAELLVEEGANRSVRIKQGKTPLDYAVAGGRSDLVSLLKGEGRRSTQDASTEERTDSPPVRSTGPLTDVEKLVRGNSAFALDLYEHLRGAEGNLFFSPYSISTALVMTYAGARENTAREMADTLYFSLDQSQLHPAFAALQAGLNQVQDAGHVRLSTANSLWPQQGHPFLAEYLSLIETHYGVSITAVDYSTRTTREAARQTINRWVEGRTQDRIKELVRPEHLNDATRLVLTNAIYFNGKWKNEFDPQKTRDETFYLSAAKSISVPMIHQTEDFRYAEDSSVQILELPYRGDELSMLILLPVRIEGLGQLEKRLTLEALGRWRDRLQKTEVIVSMPRFRMTWEAGLKAVLTGMGMVEAFTWPGANFAGLDGDPNWFVIGEVVHKAYVDVNEEGTEAAAATAVVMMLGGMPARPPEFRADHPFLFLIQENRTGSILFLGRVVDPR
jgi:serpin B